MDTELARNFLTVVEAGNFISAAERRRVSQSTVSTRIHTLENLLGCTLFTRNKAGTTLTPAGRQFQGHGPRRAIHPSPTVAILRDAARSFAEKLALRREVAELRRPPQSA